MFKNDSGPKLTIFLLSVCLPLFQLTIFLKSFSLLTLSYIFHFCAVVVVVFFKIYPLSDVEGQGKLLKL